jgi:hypothetical protein
MSHLSEKGAAALAHCRAIVGGEHDPFSAVWRDMPERERAFWLQFSNLSTLYKAAEWGAIPGAAKCTLRNTLYRGAKRLQVVAAAL